MKTELKFNGARELEKALLDLPRATAKGATRRAMKTSLEPFVVAAKRNAPKGPTGNLEDGINIGTRLTRSQAREARGSFDRESTVVMYAGSSERHAHLVEFGTGPRYQANGKFVGRMPPNGFMRRAWDQTRATVLRVLSDQMGIEVMRSVERAQRKAARAAKKGR